MSALEWNQALPAGWQAVPIRSLGRFTGGGTPSKSDQAFWSGDVPWASPKDFSEMVIGDTLDHISEEAVRRSAAAVVPKGSVLLVVRSGILRHSLPVAIAGVPMALNQDVKALTLRSSIDARYVRWLFGGLADHILAGTRRVGTTVESIDFEALLTMKVPLPPSERQTAIAEYLDRETAAIDVLDARKRRLIELLRERAAVRADALILHGPASTDESDSGIEWWPTAPAHWSVRPISTTITDCRNGVWGSEPTGGPDDVGCVRVADFDRERSIVAASDLTVRLIEPSDRLRHRLRRGDLLLEKSGGGDKQPVGKVVLFDRDDVAVCSNFIARMPVAAGHDPSYLRHLHATLYRRRVNVRSIKQSIGIQNLDSRSYLAEKVAIPPLAEQSAIAAELDDLVAGSLRLVELIQDQMALLRERRAKLVTEAVTGRAEAAAALR